MRSPHACIRIEASPGAARPHTHTHWCGAVSIPTQQLLPTQQLHRVNHSLLTAVLNEMPSAKSCSPSAISSSQQPAEGVCLLACSLLQMGLQLVAATYANPRRETHETRRINDYWSVQVSCSDTSRDRAHARGRQGSGSGCKARRVSSCPGIWGEAERGGTATPERPSTEFASSQPKRHRHPLTHRGQEKAKRAATYRFSAVRVVPTGMWVSLGITRRRVHAPARTGSVHADCFWRLAAGAPGQACDFMPAHAKAPLAGAAICARRPARRAAVAAAAAHPRSPPPHPPLAPRRRRRRR
mgnify:CR=1 FL=1